MSETASALVWAATALAITAMLCIAALRGWRAWIELRRFEIDRSHRAEIGGSSSQRIELADVRERLRKLEAIARGVDP